LSLERTLNAAAQKEKNTAVADELRRCHDYLVKHFTVSMYQGLVSVWCRCPGQGSSVGKLFSQTQYESEGAAWIKSVLSPHNEASPLVRGEAQRQTTSPARRRWLSSASRGWRFAVGPASTRTLGLTKQAAAQVHSLVCHGSSKTKSHDEPRR
jgi:hypothetical protein